MKKALEGIKVVDLTSALSGPFCTMMLADYGADVLKIEPLHGDQCRTWGPIDEKSGESGFYCYVNRNKKGATLNLKSEKGKQMFYDLVKDADILVDPFLKIFFDFTDLLSIFIVFTDHLFTCDS